MSIVASLQNFLSIHLKETFASAIRTFHEAIAVNMYRCGKLIPFWAKYPSAFGTFVIGLANTDLHYNGSQNNNGNGRDPNHIPRHIGAMSEPMHLHLTSSQTEGCNKQ